MSGQGRSGAGSHFLMLILGLLLGLTLFVAVRMDSRTELVIMSTFGVSFGMIPIIVVVFAIARRIERSHHQMMREVEQRPVPPMNNYAATPPMFLQLPPPTQVQDRGLNVARPLHTAPETPAPVEAADTIDWRLL